MMLQPSSPLSLPMSPRRMHHPRHRVRHRSKWKDAAPARIIPGTSFTAGMGTGQHVAPEELRKDFTTGGFKVMGEIGLQYEGISPSDPSVDAYFALAEELDIGGGYAVGQRAAGARVRD